MRKVREVREVRKVREEGCEGRMPTWRWQILVPLQRQSSAHYSGPKQSERGVREVRKVRKVRERRGVGEKTHLEMAETSASTKAVFSSLPKSTTSSIAPLRTLYVILSSSSSST